MSGKTSQQAIQAPPPYKKKKKLKSQKNIDTSLWLSMTEKINKKSKSQNVSSKDTSPNAKNEYCFYLSFCLALILICYILYLIDMFRF